ncbi:MAG: hypothetical protein ACYDHX_07920 [Methanothrix sp.]
MGRQKNNMLRAYNVLIADAEEEGGMAFIAYTVADAKRFAWNDGDVLLTTDTFIDLRAHWVRGANVEGLKEGQKIELIDGLRRGIYTSTIYPEKCPVCGKEADLYGDRKAGWAGCLDCMETRA